MSEKIKQCDICGETFIARNSRQHICYNTECRREYSRRVRNEYRRSSYNEAYADAFEPHIPKPDTIVAIGYAERQMAQTLEMAGKVKV